MSRESVAKTLVPAIGNRDRRNPGWERWDWWNYEEDWGSPAWEDRMAQVNARILARREKVGFISCPKCRAEHTSKTVTCRKCGYQASAD